MASEPRSQNGSHPKTDSRKNGLHVGGYRVLREIETDSLGVIYEAEHPRMHQKVAVRTIEATVARDVSFSRRFLLELRSYVALEHPSIPRLYELAYDGDSPYLVTEMIPGKTLDEVLGSGVRYDALGIIGLLRPIADALDYAHSRATVHRDVKPGNIVATVTGPVKVLDFGLAKLIGSQGGNALTKSLTETHAVAGTLPYMSPEQLRG